MPLPIPISRPDAIPKKFVLQHIKKIDQIYPNLPTKFSKDDKSICLANLVDMLLFASQERQDWEEYIVSHEKNGEVKQNVLEARLFDLPLSANNVRFLIKNRTEYQESTIEIELLQRIDRNILDKTLSSVPDIYLELNDKRQNEIFIYEKMQNKSIIRIGSYILDKNGAHDILVLDISYDHMHNKSFGYFSLANFIYLVRLYQSPASFYQAFGNDWNIVSSMSVRARKIIQSLDQYIQSRIPRDIFASLIEKNIDIPVLPEQRNGRSGKFVPLLQLMDFLIYNYNYPESRKHIKKCCSDIKQTACYVFEDQMLDVPSSSTSIKYIKPRYLKDYGHLEIKLLQPISSENIKTSVSNVSDVRIVETNERLEFYQIRNNEEQKLLGKYSNDQLEFAITETSYFYHKDHGYLSAENFKKIIELCGSEAAFYKWFSNNQRWSPIINVREKSRQIIQAIDNYIENRVMHNTPTDFFTSALTGLYSCVPEISSISSISTSILSAIGTLHLALQDPKKWKGCFMELDKDQGFISFDANLQDWAVSADRINYFESKNVYIELCKKIKPATLKGLISQISYVVIKELKEKGIKGGRVDRFEFYSRQKDNDLFLGTYTFGSNPENVIDENLTKDRINFHLFPSYMKNHHGCLSDKDYEELINKCGSKDIFEVVFGNDWIRAPSCLPKESRQIIQSIDDYLRERTFKWLERYNQGAAASGTVTLVRNR